MVAQTVEDDLGLFRQAERPGGGVDFAAKLNITAAFARQRKDGSGILAVVVNFTPTLRTNYQLGLPREGVWREIFNSDAAMFGGWNAAAGWRDVMVADVTGDGRDDIVGRGQADFGGPVSLNLATGLSSHAGTADLLAGHGARALPALPSERVTAGNFGPADLEAHVLSVSAIGEQYVDGHDVGNRPLQRALALLRHRPHHVAFGDNTNDAFSIEEIEQFHARALKTLETEHVDYVSEPKLVGVAISLRYENGRLVRGAHGDDQGQHDSTRHPRSSCWCVWPRPARPALRPSGWCW